MSRNDKSSRKRPAASLSSPAVITEPLPDDVVLGKGSSQAWRPGNTNFHSLLDEFADQYHEAISNDEKATIIHTVYTTIRRNGRFLLKHPSRNGYVEIEEQDAKRRCGQAMRYRRRRNTAITGEESDDDREARLPSPTNSVPAVAAHHLSVAAMPFPAPQRASATSAVAFNQVLTRPNSINPLVANQLPRLLPNVAPSLGLPVAGLGSSTTTNNEELFSDEDLQSVLGHPSEYNRRNIPRYPPPQG